MEKRVKIILSGKVQNVGFRYFIKNNAQELNVKGYVKNKEDGTVEIVGEGEEKNIEALIKKCQQGPLRAQVDNVVISEEKTKKEYESFRTEK